VITKTTLIDEEPQNTNKKLSTTTTPTKSSDQKLSTESKSSLGPLGDGIDEQLLSSTSSFSNLFSSSVGSKPQTPVPKKSAPKASPSVWDQDDDENNLFSAASKKSATKKSAPKKSLFGEEDGGGGRDLFG